MASLWTAVILLSVLFSGFLEVSGDGSAVELVSTAAEQNGFDYFVLALQWPATFCSTHGTTCCPQNGCCQGANYPPGFTIHGLWPSNDDGTWPSCCTNDAFDEIDLYPSLVASMEKVWPILSCSNISSCHDKQNPFWAHEWEYHGTCAAPVIRDQHAYFVSTLILYSKFNVTKVLLEAGYVPSNSQKYLSSGIISSIKEAFYATPKLVCKNGLIKEVRLCYTKDLLEVRDCVGDSDCPDYVSFPEFKFLDDTKTEDWSIFSVVKSS